MKHTILGFSQAYAMSLRRKEEVNGKVIEKKIDCTDLVILRWFVDFYPVMEKYSIDDEQYAWLEHSKLERDLPLVDISKRAFGERLQKMVDFQILTYKLTNKKGEKRGTFAMYGFGENYINLIAKEEGMSDDRMGVCSSNDIGVCVQTQYKDISINDISTKDKKETNNNIISKERKPRYYDNQELNVVFLDYLDTRKKMRVPNTDRAISMLIAKLQPFDDAEKIEILNKSILNGWKSVYPESVLREQVKVNAQNVGKNGILLDGRKTDILDDIL